MNGHGQAGTAPLRLQKPDLWLGDGVAVQRHPATQQSLFLRGITTDPHMVALVHLAAGMGHLLGKSSVIGEQQQALGVHIQPSDGPDPLAAAGHQLRGVLPPALVAEGGDDAPGLIQHQIDALGPVRQLLAVNQNQVLLRVSLLAQRGPLPIDQDPPLLNHFLRLPPGGHTSGRQELLQTFFHPFSPKIR